MPHVRLCPCANPVVEPQNQGNSLKEIHDNESACVAPNKYAEELITQRNQKIYQAIHGAATWNDKVEALISALDDDSSIFSNDGTRGNQTTTWPSASEGKPLEGYILAIIWELHHSGMSQTILGPWINVQCGTVQDFVTLLTFAATFEVKSTKVS